VPILLLRTLGKFQNQEPCSSLYPCTILHSYYGLSAVHRFNIKLVHIKEKNYKLSNASVLTDSAELSSQARSRSRFISTYMTAGVYLESPSPAEDGSTMQTASLPDCSLAAVLQL
jgi:hypothetical protein